MATLNSEWAADSLVPAAIPGAAAGDSTMTGEGRAYSLDMHLVWTGAAVREIAHRYQAQV
jgi:hypothetical protein